MCIEYVARDDDVLMMVIGGGRAPNRIVGHRVSEFADKLEQWQMEMEDTNNNLPLNAKRLDG